MSFDPTKNLVLALVVAVALTACKPATENEGAASHLSAQPTAEFERGPHRGRLLRDGDFSLELQIFEDGVPPEYHVYLFQNNKPLAPEAAQVTVELKRLDGEVNLFAFTQQGDFLRGDSVVHEPHSFAVTVKAVRGSQTHNWNFDSFEGRTTIPAATAEAAGIKLEAAGPATIRDTVVLSGRLTFSAENVRSVSARFPGPIRDVAVSVGDNVSAGQRLARVEGNESLLVYSVTAPIAGTVIERNANPGENAGAEPLFVIASSRTLWAELSLFPRDLAHVKPGQSVELIAADGDLRGTGRVLRVLPATISGRDGASGIYVARVAIDNAGGTWRPGLFVEGKVQVSATPVPLAVKRSGLQAFRDFTVVFEQVGETYEVRMLELGRQDDSWVEVTAGLKPGARYVSENSYLIKADIEKSGASHDH